MVQPVVICRVAIFMGSIGCVFVRISLLSFCSPFQSVIHVYFPRHGLLSCSHIWRTHTRLFRQTNATLHRTFFRPWTLHSVVCGLLYQFWLWKRWDWIPRFGFFAVVAWRRCDIRSPIKSRLHPVLLYGFKATADERRAKTSEVRTPLSWWNW